MKVFPQLQRIAILRKLSRSLSLQPRRTWNKQDPNEKKNEQNEAREWVDFPKGKGSEKHFQELSKGIEGADVGSKSGLFECLSVGRASGVGHLREKESCK